MPHNVFIQLIRLCVDCNALSFGSQFYMQKFGMGMGSPLSPILSNLYMEYYESTLLPTISPPNLTWFRHVDDIFLSRCVSEVVWLQVFLSLAQYKEAQL